MILIWDPEKITFESILMLYYASPHFQNWLKRHLVQCKSNFECKMNVGESEFL